MMAERLFLSVLLVLICLHRNSSQRPETGVALRFPAMSPSAVLPNISILNESNLLNGISCLTALQTNINIGEWYYPNGSRIGTQDDSPALYTLQRIGRVDLHSNNRISKLLEGIYTCIIPDDSGMNQTLHVGIYTDASYQGQAFPRLTSPPILRIETSHTTYPSNFSLTCTSSMFPPTEVIWMLDGQPLPNDMFDSFQVLKDSTLSIFDNILRVRGGLTGVYECTVGNSRGNNSSTLEVTAPAVVEDIVLSPIGNNSVNVTWHPLTNARQYRVSYQSGSGNDLTTITVNHSTAIVRGLTAGVEYSVRIQGLGGLVGPISSPVTTTIQAPAPPTITMVSSQSATSILVQWSIPSSSPGLEINGFEVIYSPVVELCDAVEGGRALIDGGQKTSYTLKGLEEFMNYSIHIRSRGVEGVGVLSVPVHGKTGISAPGPPVRVTAVGNSSSQSFAISWEPVECEDVNDMNIDHYIVRFGLAGSDNTVDQKATSMMHHNVNNMNQAALESLVYYTFQVAAVNSNGSGQYSSPVKAVILEVPGQVQNFKIDLDIVSVLVTWEPPSREKGREFVTEYVVTHRIVGGNPIGQTRVNGTSFRVMDLLPEVEYMFSVRALIEDLKGEEIGTTGRTVTIGQVRGVRTTPLDAVSVNVSWMKLDSHDITSYRVYFYLDANSKEYSSFPGISSSGVIDGLEQEGQYQFQVVGVVIVNGLEYEGQTRSGTSVTYVGGLNDDEESLPGSVIASIVIVILVLLVLFITFLLITVFVWRRNRSGKFVLNSRKNRYELNSKQSTTTAMPLPDFEPFIPTSMPVIQQSPMDTTALEGERVTFKPKVSGTPPPTVAWYHDGSMVSSDYSMEVEEDGTLIFFCVELKHTGTYKYTVSNNAGSIQGQVELKVFSEDAKCDNRLQNSDSLQTNKVSVRNFGQYVEEMHANSNRGFKEQFHMLTSGEEEHSIRSAQDPDNTHLNRFTNITVYDDNRVRLKPVGGVPGCQHDYINASYINGYFMAKKFIATQGPLESTVVDFWRMVWQLRTPTIVMITNINEGGRMKCTQYWPDADTTDYGPFRVFLSGESVYGNFTIRTFHVNLTLKTQNPLKVVQYHFTSWPDHGVPDYVAPMLAFHRRIKAEHKSMLGPMVVHCSAGVGRSGTFIALDIALQQATGEDYIDIVAIVANLRRQRMKTVQTMDQYIFIHDAILESLTCGDTQIPLHDFQHSIEYLHRWDPNTGMSGFQSQFHVMNQMSPKPEEAICIAARENMEKNRNDLYLPPDKHRVILKTEHPNYINAVFANGYKQKKKFIITQGPLPNTCRDFWKMVYERNSPAIVMLSGMVENEEEVCYKYWPTRGIEQYGEYDVSLLEQTMHDGFLERIYSLTDSKSGQAHRVSQFQVINWDQHGVMFNLMAIINIVNTVLSLQKTSSPGPIVVHCSDTVTRSAIFCSVSNAIECCKIENVVDIFQVVKALRSQRPGAIPTVEQYQIIHDILLYYIQNLSDLK